MFNRWLVCSILLAGLNASAAERHANIPKYADVVAQPQPPAKTLSWGEEQQRQEHKESHHCLTPSEPGCQNMWQQEWKQQNDKQVQRREQRNLTRHSHRAGH
ncbi:hypothetical protein ACQKDS_08310 [Serratia sp. NPDC078593]|uniref:hypothetical protein n=1 Tax=unclassified Serratia (in: enterobacteria) TaxID=2647522 RepID=UPI0037D96822